MTRIEKSSRRGAKAQRRADHTEARGHGETEGIFGGNMEALIDAARRSLNQERNHGINERDENAGGVATDETQRGTAAAEEVNHE